MCFILWALRNGIFPWQQPWVWEGRWLLMLSVCWAQWGIRHCFRTIVKHVWFHGPCCCSLMYTCSVSSFYRLKTLKPRPAPCQGLSAANMKPDLGPHLFVNFCFCLPTHFLFHSVLNSINQTFADLATKHNPKRREAKTWIQRSLLLMVFQRPRWVFLLFTPNLNIFQSLLIVCRPPHWPLACLSQLLKCVGVYFRVCPSWLVY